MDVFVYREGSDGRRVLHAEGVSLPSIAARFGTPTYCYSNAVLVARYRALAEAVPHARICYSIKANDNLAVIRTFARLAPAPISSPAASCAAHCGPASCRTGWSSQASARPATR